MAQPARTLLVSDDGRARVWAAPAALSRADADAAYTAILRDTQWQRHGHYEVAADGDAAATDAALTALRAQHPQLPLFAHAELRLYASGRDFDPWRVLPAGGAVLVWLGRTPRDVAYGSADADRMLVKEAPDHGTAHVCQGDAARHYRVCVPRRPKHEDPCVVVMFYDEQC